MGDMGRGVMGRVGMDKEGIMGIRGAGAGMGLWRRCWRVWRVVVVWMLVCFSRCWIGGVLGRPEDRRGMERGKILHFGGQGGNKGMWEGEYERMDVGMAQQDCLYL